MCSDCAPTAKKIPAFYVLSLASNGTFMAYSADFFAEKSSNV